MIGNMRRNRADQLHDEAAIEVNSFAAHIGTRLLPIGEGNGIPEYYTDILQYLQGCSVNALDLIGFHRLDNRQCTPQCWKHIDLGSRSHASARISTTSSGGTLLDGHAGSIWLRKP